MQTIAKITGTRPPQFYTPWRRMFAARIRAWGQVSGLALEQGLANFLSAIEGHMNTLRGDMIVLREMVQRLLDHQGMKG